MKLCKHHTNPLQQSVLSVHKNMIILNPC